MFLVASNNLVNSGVLIMLVEVPNFCFASVIFNFTLSNLSLSSHRDNRLENVTSA